MKICRVEIDEVGIAMVFFEPPKAGLSAYQTELIKDSVIADYAADGRMIAVEILDPKLTDKLIGDGFKSILSQLRTALGGIDDQG